MQKAIVTDLQPKCLATCNDVLPSLNRDVQDITALIKATLRREEQHEESVKPIRQKREEFIAKCRSDLSEAKNQIDAEFEVQAKMLRQKYSVSTAAGASAETPAK